VFLSKQTRTQLGLRARVRIRAPNLSSASPDTRRGPKSSAERDYTVTIAHFNPLVANRDLPIRLKVRVLAPNPNAADFAFVDGLSDKHCSFSLHCTDQTRLGSLSSAPGRDATFTIQIYMDITLGAMARRQGKTRWRALASQMNLLRVFVAAGGVDSRCCPRLTPC
jgi:hypothetical protein